MRYPNDPLVLARRRRWLLLAAVFWLVATGCRGNTPAPRPEERPKPPAEPAPQGKVVVPSEGVEADLAATRAFLSGRPRYEQPQGEGLTAIEGLPSLSAETCAMCHRDIYEEWKVSVHAAAWTDLQYQEEIVKSDSRWLCLNCHTPLLVQQDLWPRGLVDDDVDRPIVTENPVFDEALREEGVTCMACHLGDGAVSGPGLPDSTAPHAVETDPKASADETCYACHQAIASYPGKTFICVFETADEWRAGSDGSGKGCVDCHMPAVERPAATGGVVRKVARHWWAGSGIPKVEGVAPPPEAGGPGLALSAEAAEGKLHVKMVNQNAGHLLPTGDPERWIQVDVRFVDDEDAPVGEASTWRIAQVWKWEPKPTKVSDNRLKQGEARTEVVAIPLGAATAIVEASSHRMSERNAGYHHLLGRYPLSVKTHRIDVKVR